MAYPEQIGSARSSFQLEAELHRIVNLTPQMLAVMEPDGRIPWVNEVALDYLGIGLEDLGSNDLQARIFHPDDLQRSAEDRRNALARGTPFETELHLRGKDGTYRWFLIRYQPLKDAEGRVLRWYGGATDIEERKRAEEARQEIEEQWKAAFESNPTMYFILDVAGEIVSVNPFGAEQLGYTVSELVGQSVLDVFYEPDRQSVQRHAKDCFERPGRMISWEARKIRKDGTMIWVRETGNAVFLKNRQVLLVICEVITEQKRAEEALRRSEKELRGLVETIPVMAFTYLPDGSTEFVNQRLLEYTGLSADTISGHGWQSTVHADDLESHLNKWCASLASGQPFENEVRHRNAKGEYRWFLVRAVPLRDEHEIIRKWYGILTDIEDRKRTEEALRQSEQRFRNVIETIPTMAWTARPNGENDFANRSWLDYTGVPAKNAAGDGWAVSFHPADIATHVAKWHISLSSGKPFENESRIKRASDGEYRWFLTRAVPLRDENGNIVKWYGVATDIEDRKRAEAFLTGEKRILEMVAKGDSLAQILDSLCRLVEEQTSGVLASILLVDGDRLRHGAAPSLPKAYTDPIDGAAFGPVAGSCGTAVYRREQVIVEDIATDPLWADYRESALRYSLRACSSTPVFSSQGNVIAAFGMYYREPRKPSLRDQEIIEQITHLAGVAIERKQTQDALRRSEVYLAESQRLTKTGSWAYNPATEKAIYWSEEMFRIAELDPKQGPPAAETFLQRVHPEDRNSMIEGLRKAALAKTEYEDHHRLLLPDGTIKHILGIGHPVFDHSGKVIEYVGTEVDETERKRAEAERERLRQLEVDLARINRVSMMGELTASLAHEIKQPIAAAVSNAEACLHWLARDEPDLAEVREAATEVVKEAMRAAEIMTRIRSLFQKEEAKRKVTDLNEVIADTVSLIREEAERSAISVRTELDAELPRISADRVQLQQVLVNLMLNGLEAMNGTRGELIIRSQRNKDGRPMISVSDIGTGLPAGEGEKIFDAFFTTKSQGIGMGLAICRSIIESHGGRLWATANPGKGSTFCFTLPNEGPEGI